MNIPCPRCQQPFQDWTGEMCPECYLNYRSTPAGARAQYETALEVWRQEVAELACLKTYEGKVAPEDADALDACIYMQVCKVETALGWFRWHKTRYRLVRRNARHIRAAKTFDNYRILQVPQ